MLPRLAVTIAAEDWRCEITRDVRRCGVFDRAGPDATGLA